MSQNDQTHFKNFAANAAKVLKCVWPFWDIMHYGVKVNLFNLSNDIINKLFHKKTKWVKAALRGKIFLSKGILRIISRSFTVFNINDIKFHEENHFDGRTSKTRFKMKDVEVSYMCIILKKHK